MSQLVEISIPVLIDLSRSLAELYHSFKSQFTIAMSPYSSALTLPFMLLKYLCHTPQNKYNPSRNKMCELPSANIFSSGQKTLTRCEPLTYGEMQAPSTNLW